MYENAVPGFRVFSLRSQAVEHQTTFNILTFPDFKHYLKKMLKIGETLTCEKHPRDSFQQVLLPRKPLLTF